jgi:hypothetical protein
MPFTSPEIDQLGALLAESDGGSQLAGEFRRRFPGRSLTQCDRSDMGVEAPYAQYPKVDLYFADGRDHCWQITGDPTLATGVVLARRGSQA